MARNRQALWLVSYYITELYVGYGVTVFGGIRLMTICVAHGFTPMGSVMCPLCPTLILGIKAYIFHDMWLCVDASIQFR